MPTDVPFNKSHVEIGYSDANNAHWMYCDPIEGRLPQEGTDEAATDTHVLELLRVEPELGAKFTVTFSVDGHETTQTFTLCGWWEYDEAVTGLQKLPEKMEQFLASESCEAIPKYASQYFNHNSVFFIGRNLDYALGLEGSLKLKEISYIHSEAYASGELKHGTISVSYTHLTLPTTSRV